MTGDNGHAPDETPAPPAAPVITITFAGVGMADMVLAAPGVQLSQLMAAAWLLDSVCREARAGSVAQEAMRQVIVDPMTVPAELREVLRRGH